MEILAESRFALENRDFLGWSKESTPTTVCDFWGFLIQKRIKKPQKSHTVVGVRIPKIGVSGFGGKVTPFGVP